ncbi:hypothetical protein BP5796_06738 [Coleophoma crateriformis]|uniref:Kynurenine 3-monooxygenase n=1 Tax=Coleophoma crateriformis TaxID=565419 RepID=A0A3D8RPC0_9HELO|nr:hypothetical protein BP5796_06738 [Coleophoma crateriformis]
MGKDMSFLFGCVFYPLPEGISSAKTNLVDGLDLRDPSTIPLNFTKSINLALSERGINSIKESGRPELLEKVMSDTIPMRGRMIHGENASGLYEQAQDYDAHGRTIFAADRAGLNKHLLDGLEAMPNVKFFFNHKMVGADFKKNTAWFQRQGKDQENSQSQEIEVSFDLLIGADGAHSAARYHLMKFTRMDYQQVYIDALWCEFSIAAQPPSKEDTASIFQISPNHLHIWPGKEHMFIAIPSSDGSFTCTLFMPSRMYASLESDATSVPEFFDQNFPGVTTLISPSELVSSFKNNPHLPLISIKCQPHHFSSSAVVIGDAAHAMYPFYGQGMNAGLEDVRVLFEILDKYSSDNRSNLSAPQRSLALAEYSSLRTLDAHAINELAAQNYVEMRASVISPVYKFRKWMEELLSVYVPSLEWKTKYARVSFGNERYSEVVRKSERQGKLLLRGLLGLVAGPVVIGGLVALFRWKRNFKGFVPGWRFG